MNLHESVLPKFLGAGLYQIRLTSHRKFDEAREGTVSELGHMLHEGVQNVRVMLQVQNVQRESESYYLEVRSFGLESIR